MTKELPLSPLRQKFAEGVAAGKTTTQAAIDAGYSEKTAKKQAARLVGNSRIIAAIQLITSQIARPAIATAAERQEFWTTVIRDGAHSMRDRLKASELLGKSQGQFIENHNHRMIGALVDGRNIARRAAANPEAAGIADQLLDSLAQLGGIEPSGVGDGDEQRKTDRSATFAIVEPQAA